MRNTGPWYRVRIGYPQTVYQHFCQHQIVDQLCLSADYFKKFFMKIVNQNGQNGYKIWLTNKSHLVICFLINIFFQATLGFTLQFNFKLCFIVHKWRSRHGNSVLKELRKIVDLPRVTGEDVFLINILQNSFFCISASHDRLVSSFSSFFIHLFIRMRLNLYQHDLIKVLNSYL